MLAAVLACCVAGCGREGSGNIVERNREAVGFTRVSAKNGLHVAIVIGPATTLQVRGDDNLLDSVLTQVVDGELLIETKDQVELMPSQPIVISVTTPSLGALTIEDGGTASASGLNVETFEARAGPRTQLNLSGTGRRLSLTAELGSRVAARDFPVEKLLIDASGDAYVTATVSQSVSGILSGGSDLVCYGRPVERLVEVTGNSDAKYP
jgi:hypothetical protein